MIFLGDIACPTPILSKDLQRVFENNSEIFRGKKIVANLEGLVNDDESYLKAKSPVLFNHPSAITVLKQNGLEAVSLANNHTLDIPQSFAKTQTILDNHQISFSGAGNNYESAKEPCIIHEDGNTIAIFSFCWDFLLYNQNNPSNDVFIAEIQEAEILQEIEKYKLLNSTHKLVVLLHWSFDLEILPFPMYRKWAKKLIDTGVSCVIGCHSHCVQGGEIYKDGHIIYGLGNFFLPSGVFANGNLNYPEFSKVQLGFEWSPTDNNSICHWFSYNKTNHHHYIEKMVSEDTKQSETLKKYSPFQGMSHEEYLKYFKKNRRKKKLIPVFKDDENYFSNKLKIKFLILRATIARFMAERGIIGWQN